MYLEGRGRVYRLDDGSGWVAADEAGWLPGVFADEDAARAALNIVPVDEWDLPLIVVRADDETVHVVKSALHDPDHFLTARHRALDGDERLATAVTLALLEHSRGMDLLDLDE